MVGLRARRHRLGLTCRVLEVETVLHVGCHMAYVRQNSQGATFLSGWNRFAADKVGAHESARGSDAKELGLQSIRHVRNSLFPKHRENLESDSPWHML